MSQWSTAATVLEAQPSYEVLIATPYQSQAASSVEPSLGQLTPRTLKRRLDLASDAEEVSIFTSKLFWLVTDVVFF